MLTRNSMQSTRTLGKSNSWRGDEKEDCNEGRRSGLPEMEFQTSEERRQRYKVVHRKCNTDDETVLKWEMFGTDFTRQTTLGPLGDREKWFDETCAHSHYSQVNRIYRLGDFHHVSLGCHSDQVRSTLSSGCSFLKSIHQTDASD